MKPRLLFFLVLAALAATGMRPAAANPWPDINAASVWPYFTVTVSQDAGDPNIFIYNVSVDASQTGWSIKAFVPYVSGFTGTPFPQGSDAYAFNGGSFLVNTAGWTGTNGGWEYGKLDPNANPMDNAAFGWQTGSPSTYLNAGSSATFYANLGSAASGWDQSVFVVHVVQPDGNTFWGKLGSGVVPEPGSLVLASSGLVALVGWAGLKRRRRLC